MLSNSEIHLSTLARPGRDDLESTRSRPRYNLVEIPEAMFRGIVPGADPDYDAKTGTLKHAARTSPDKSQSRKI